MRIRSVSDLEATHPTIDITLDAVSIPRKDNKSIFIHGSRAYTQLLVQINQETSWYAVPMLVDTGADVTLLPHPTVTKQFAISRVANSKTKREVSWKTVIPDSFLDSKKYFSVSSGTSSWNPRYLEVRYAFPDVGNRSFDIKAGFMPGPNDCERTLSNFDASVKKEGGYGLDIEGRTIPHYFGLLSMHAIARFFDISIKTIDDEKVMRLEHRQGGKPFESSQTKAISGQ